MSRALVLPDRSSDARLTSASPRTVVHLHTFLGRGGTERQLVALLGGLDAARWTSRVVCFRAGGEYLDDVLALGIVPDHLTLPSSLAHPGVLLAIGRLAARLARERAAVLHCHDPWSAVIGVPAARIANVPVIASRRDLGHHLSRLQRLALRAAMAGASCVLANSTAVATQAREADGVPAARLTVVENGIDLDDHDRRAARLDGPVPPGPFVLAVGNMIHPAKGHDDLIAAAAILRETAPGLRVVLVGGGEREPALRAQATALGDTVVFAGERTDVPALLRHAELFCHPARYEGMPNAVLEAMAAGLAVAATAVGGVPEMIRDGADGLLVPPGAPERLAAAILALHRDPGRRARLGRAARARVEARFTLGRMVERMDALYTRLAA